MNGAPFRQGPSLEELRRQKAERELAELRARFLAIAAESGVSLPVAARAMRELGVELTTAMMKARDREIAAVWARIRAEHGIGPGTCPLSLTLSGLVLMLKLAAVGALALQVLELLGALFR